MNNSPIYAAPTNLRLPSEPPPPLPTVPSETAVLMRQLLEVQKEQLALAKAAAVAADTQTRWRNFLARWSDEFPDVGRHCKDVLPTIERMYLTMINQLALRLKDDDAEGFESEFVMAEFLDKYGLRLSQLGTIISQLSPIADATPASEKSSDDV